MSVRAYRLISKKVAEQSSFNLWHDDELIDFLKEQRVETPTHIIEGFESIAQSSEGFDGGSVCVSVRALEKAIKSYPFEANDYRIEAIKADIAHAKKHREEYVVYECY